MQAPNPSSAHRRPSRSAKLEARCSPSLRADFVQIATAREADISDLVREACLDWAARAKAQLHAQLSRIS